MPGAAGASTATGCWRTRIRQRPSVVIDRECVTGRIRRYGHAICVLRWGTGTAGPGDGEIGVLECRLNRSEPTSAIHGRSHVRTVVVRLVRLHCLLRRIDVSLGVGVVGLLTLVQERRNGDRSEDAQNQHDDQELNEREARLILTHPLTELKDHLEPSLESLPFPPEPRTATASSMSS